MGLAAVGIERSQPAPVEILQIFVGTGERQIDVIEHARIARAGLARCAGQEPLGERRNDGGIVVVEEGAMPRAMRMRLRSRGWGVCYLVLLVRLGERVGHEPRARDGPCADCRADQEGAASFIMLAHASLLPVRYELGFPRLCEF